MPNVSIGAFDGTKPGSSMFAYAMYAASAPDRTLTKKIQCQLDDVDEVAADRRAEERAGDRADPEERAGHPVLLARIAREEDALRRRDDGAAAEPLKNPEHDERRQAPGEAAERARDREEQDRSGEVALEAEAPLETSPTSG